MGGERNRIAPPPRDAGQVAGGPALLPRVAAGGPALLAVAMLAANALHYAYIVVQSRLLGPPAYGALAALLGLVLVGAVPGMAVQAVAARHTALRDRDGQDVAALWASMLRGVVVLGAGLGAVTAAATPLLVAFLHLDSALPALVLALCLLPLPLVSVLHGLLQGRQRWGALAVVVLTGATVKLACGVAFVLAGGGVAAALAGAALGFAVEAALGLRLVRPAWSRRAGTRLAPEVAAAAAGVLGLWLLVGADVVLARHLLPAEASGLYGVGAALTKIAYWAPQPIVVILYPRLVAAPDAGRSLMRGAGLIVCFGALLAALAVSVGGPAVGLVFGREYVAVAPLLWVFALLGTALGLVQLVLYAALAARRRGIAAVLVAATGCESVLLVALASSVGQVVAIALLCVTGALAAGWRVVTR